MHKRILWRGKQQGFTLIELLVVIVLVGILLGFGVGSYSKLTHQIAIRSLNKQIIHLLTQTRLTAMSNNQLVSLCVTDNVTNITPSTKCKAWTNLTSGNANHKKGWVIFIDKNKDNTIGNLDNIIKTQPFDDFNNKVGVLAISSIGQSIRFTPRGLLSSQGSTITIGSNNPQYSGSGYDREIIIASNTGRIRTEIVK